MKAELNKKTSEFEVVISPKKNEWENAITKSEKELLGNLSIKGFRKGKVPANIAKKHISDTEVYSKAMLSILDSLAKQAVESVPKEQMVLDGPSYHPMKMNKETLEVKFSYPVYPEIKLSDYKKLNLKYEEKKVDAKAVEAELEKIASSQTMLKSKEGNIAKGNVVVFDFEGSVDGKLFDGGKSENYELEIGSGQFIPGFEDQMIGLKKGDKKDLKVTFPKEYHSEELKGKEAVFKVNIKEIKEKEVAVINDEFAKGLNIKEVKDLDSLKKYVKSVFTEQERQNARSKFQQQAFEAIKKETEIIVPNTLVAKETETLIQRFAKQIKQQGMDIKQYMQMTGSDEIKMEAQFKDQAENRLRDSLIFAEISKKKKKKKKKKK